MKNRVVSEEVRNNTRIRLLGKPSLNIGKFYVKRKKIKCKNCNKILNIREKDPRIFCNKKCEAKNREGTYLTKKTKLKIGIKNKNNKRPDLCIRNKLEKNKMYGDKNPSKRPEVRKKQRIRRQKEVLNSNFIMSLGKNETQYLDELELSLGYKIIRQYRIIGYFIDGYIPELNLAIEIDENHHFINNKLNLKDIEREKNIKKKLNCKFLRIKDYD